MTASTPAGPRAQRDPVLHLAAAAVLQRGRRPDRARSRTARPAGRAARCGRLGDRARPTSATPRTRPGLTAFYRALATEADLTPAGRRFARGAMEAALTNRLTIQREFTAEPRMRTASGRTGSRGAGTAAQRDDAATEPAGPRPRQPVATAVGGQPASPATFRRTGRGSTLASASAERATWILDRIAPSARALHPTGPRMPTECVTLFANSFASMEFSAIYQVPSYTQWLLSTDMRPHYAHYAQQLQLLGWHDHRDRWSLKSPAHLFWVDELVESLPEARLVMLHRDPVEVVASFCSLAATLAGANARAVDRTALGFFWVGTWAGGVTRAERARTLVHPDRLHDLRYADLVADPVAAVRRHLRGLRPAVHRGVRRRHQRSTSCSPPSTVAACTATPLPTSD